MEDKTMYRIADDPKDNPKILFMLKGDETAAITIDMVTGRVTIRPDITLDQASQLFWEAIENWRSAHVRVVEL